LAALSWREGDNLELFLARQPNDGIDIVEAEATGTVRIAVPLTQLLHLLEEIDADTISLSSNGTDPLLIKRIGDDRFLALQTLCAFNFTLHEAA
jgi:hypothetical protein